MAGTIRALAGPVALANGTYVTNIYNPASALIFGTIKHIHVNNNTAGALTFRLYKGATGANAAGTDEFYDKSVAPKENFDYYCSLRMESTDFLVGGGSAAGLTITVEGDETVK